MMVGRRGSFWGRVTFQGRAVMLNFREVKTFCRSGRYLLHYTVSTPGVSPCEVIWINLYKSHWTFQIAPFHNDLLFFWKGLVTHHKYGYLWCKVENIHSYHQPCILSNNCHYFPNPNTPTSSIVKSLLKTTCCICINFHPHCTLRIRIPCRFLVGLMVSPSYRQRVEGAWFPTRRCSSYLEG